MVYATCSFNAASTRTLQWSLSWIPFIQLSKVSPISVRSILIMSSHVCLDCPTVLFPISLAAKIWRKLIFRSCCMSYSLQPSWFNHSDYSMWAVQTMKFLIMKLPLLSFLIFFFKYFETLFFHKVRDHISLSPTTNR